MCIYIVIELWNFVGIFSNHNISINAHNIKVVYYFAKHYSSTRHTLLNLINGKKLR